MGAEWERVDARREIVEAGKSGSGRKLERERVGTGRE